ncbi:MAG: hypothetical protein JW779_14445 [Candidatus Thorarchaeota archaeon]|nr:hypothetical protein [Candidatus Thorarchaeota archaeon]
MRKDVVEIVRKINHVYTESNDDSIPLNQRIENLRSLLKELDKYTRNPFLRSKESSIVMLNRDAVIQKLSELNKKSEVLKEKEHERIREEEILRTSPWMLLSTRKTYSPQNIAEWIDQGIAECNSHLNENNLDDTVKCLLYLKSQIKKHKSKLKQLGDDIPFALSSKADKVYQIAIVRMNIRRAQSMLDLITNTDSKEYAESGNLESHRKQAFEFIDAALDVSDQSNLEKLHAQALSVKHILELNLAIDQLLTTAIIQSKIQEVPLEKRIALLETALEREKDLSSQYPVSSTPSGRIKHLIEESTHLANTYKSILRNISSQGETYYQIIDADDAQLTIDGFILQVRNIEKQLSVSQLDDRQYWQLKEKAIVDLKEAEAIAQRFNLTDRLEAIWRIMKSLRENSRINPDRDFYSAN